jgi:hypothetical protein
MLPLLTSFQRLKSALWLSIGKIVDEETIKLGINATPQFIGALTEMVWAQVGMYSFRFSVLNSHNVFVIQTSSWLELTGASF